MKFFVITLATVFTSVGFAQMGTPSTTEEEAPYEYSEPVMTEPMGTSMDEHSQLSYGQTEDWRSSRENSNPSISSGDTDLTQSLPTTSSISATQADRFEMRQNRRAQYESEESSFEESSEETDYQ
jgi:hypothetical protein